MVEITGYHQSGRELVNLQRIIRSDPNLTEDYQQFDVEAAREPFVTTEDLTIVLEEDTFDHTEASPIQSPASSVISTASNPSEEFPTLPLDVDFQDTTENVTSIFDMQDVSITPAVDTTAFIAKESEDLYVNPEVEKPSPTDILINPQVSIDDETELQSPSVAPSPYPTDPPQSNLLTSIATPSPDSPLTLATPMDASKEISDKESTNKLEYSSLSSKEEEQENMSYVVVTHLPEISKDPHESISNSEEEEYLVGPGIVNTKPLRNIAENLSTTEAPEPTSTEPSGLPNFPIFYPGLRIATVLQIPEKVDPLPPNPTWPMKMNDIFSVDHQLFPQSVLQNEQPDFYPRVVLPQFKPSQSLYPDVPNSFYTFSPIIQPNQPKFRQAITTSIDPPRAPYSHPQGSSNPFYRPFESAFPKPRRLVFPPISNTRENFRFRVNWADELGQSDWA